MFWKRTGGIKPYGYDWNGDRSAPDYDWRRDPWRPDSPVHGQYPRRPWLREAAKEPIWWALAAWFAATAGLVALYTLDAISKDAFFVGWVGRLLVLLIGLMVVAIWSSIVWFRKTPRGERGPALREKLKRAPRAIGVFVAAMVVCAGLEMLEKQYGVPILGSFGALFAVCIGIVWWRERVQRLEP